MTRNNERDKVKSFEHLRQYIASAVFCGRKYSCTEVDDYVSTRYIRKLQVLLYFLNLFGTVLIVASLGGTVLSLFFDSKVPNWALQTAWMLEVSVVAVSFSYDKIFNPPLIKGESRKPKYFHMLYGMLVSSAILLIACFSGPSTKWKWVDFILCLLCLALGAMPGNLMQYDKNATDDVLIEIAERDYGAFDLDFFKNIERKYKGPSEKCPVYVKNGKLYVRIDAEPDHDKEVQKKEMPDFERLLWNYFQEDPEKYIRKLFPKRFTEWFFKTISRKNGYIRLPQTPSDGASENRTQTQINDQDNRSESTNASTEESQN